MSDASKEELNELAALGAEDIQVVDSGYLTYVGSCRFEGEQIKVEGFTHWSAVMGLIAKVRKLQKVAR